MRLRLLTAALILLNAGSAYAARVVISINEHSQEMTVMVDGRSEYVWPVSTGVIRYTTPRGTYKPFRMEEFHYSEEWDDAPMPHSIFFTRLGHAIHGTEHVENLGRRASHGCVRLDPGNAATLFSLVQDVGMPNTTVVIMGKAGRTPNTTAKDTGGAGKRAKKTAVIMVTTDRNTNTIAVVEERPDKWIKKKRQLWPYERPN
jgi:L,D-transpeptidase catalytic domain